MENTEQENLISKVRLSTKEESDYWPLFIQKLHEEAPGRIEDSAKFFFGVVSLSFAILSRNIFTPDAKVWIVFAIVGCWIISIILALFVLLPSRIKYFSDSAESIKRAVLKITKRKMRTLVASISFYILALIATLVNNIL